MAEHIKKDIGVEAELIRGGGGVYDVVVDGKNIFSKHKVGRFPEPHEIIGQLKPVS